MYVTLRTSDQNAKKLKGVITVTTFAKWVIWDNVNINGGN